MDDDAFYEDIKKAWAEYQDTREGKMVCNLGVYHTVALYFCRYYMNKRQKTMTTKIVDDIIKEFRNRHFFDTKSREAYMIEALNKVEQHYLAIIKSMRESNG